MKKRGWWTLALLSAAGCSSDGSLMRGLNWGPPPEPPPAIVNAPLVDENPVYIPQGAFNYAQVFENVLSVLDGYEFEIAEANRADGRIETVPKVAPGLLAFFRKGNPTFDDRLLYTFQTYRYRLSVVIQPAEGGGYFIDVKARRELEDLPSPVRSTVGAAIFRVDNDIDRTLEVLDPSFVDPRWIPRGRDIPLEQELILLLKRCM